MDEIVKDVNEGWNDDGEEVPNTSLQYVTSFSSPKGTCVNAHF